MAEHAQSTDEAKANFPQSDHQESSHQRNGTDFVDNVQLRCKSIEERVRLVKQSVDVTGKENVSLDLSDINGMDGSSPKSTNDAQNSSEMDPQERGQRIKQRVERIMELVRSTAQHAEFPIVKPETSEETSNQVTTDTEQVLCLETMPAVEEKTLESNDKTAEQAQEPITGKIIDKEIANETLERRSDNVAENTASILPHSNQIDLENPNDHSSLKPCSTEQSTRDEDPYSQMAKYIVQDVFERIGCYESFIRRASWADEPSSGDLGAMIMAFSFTDLYEKILTSKNDSSELDTSAKTDGIASVALKTAKTDGIASVAPNTAETDGIASVAPKTAEIKTEVFGAESLACTNNQSNAASLVTSRDVRNTSQKRISLKRAQKRWTGLKKRRKSFAAGKKENGTKMLTLHNSTAEAAGCSEAGSRFANSACPPAAERWKTVDEEKLAPLKEFIVLGGAKTKDGEDIVILNPSKIPSKREFTGRKEYNEIMDCLFLYAQKFTEEKVKSEKFVITIHAVRQRRSRLRSRKWATEFYKFLKDRYQTRLSRCVLYKPSFKLKALVILSRPFFSNYMKEKIFIVKSHRDFAKAQGLPESNSFKKT